MRNTRSDKKKLENIGRELFAAGALRESEIEKIAAREDLFSGVLARVKASPAPIGAEPFSFARFVRRHELGLGGALAAVLCVGVLGLYLQVRSDDISLREVPAPAIQPEAARSNAPAQPVKHDIAPAPAQDRIITEPEVTERPAPERTIYRQSRPSAQTRPQRASLNETTETEFYPVTYAGDNGELTRGGRVIRVDVSRATLFAMGINVPLENESPTVKADLVIGPDGVTRAIRLVE